MTTDGALVQITALIRPHMEGYVVRVLHDLADFPGFFVCDVRGQGRGRGKDGAFVSSEWDLTYHRYLELRLVCRADQADKICESIANAAWTGNKGDGVVLTTPVRSFDRIREVGRRPSP